MADEFPEVEHDSEEEGKYSGDESNDCDEAIDDAEDPSLEDMFDSLQDDYDAQEKLLDQARAERDALRVDIAQLKQQQTQESIEIGNFKDQIRSLKEERDRLQSQHSKLSQQSKSQKAHLKRVQKENTDQDLALGSLKKQIARLETEVSKFNSKNKTASSNRPPPSIDDIEDEGFSFRGTAEVLSEQDPVILPNPTFNLQQTPIAQGNPISEQEESEHHAESLKPKPVPTNKEIRKIEKEVKIPQLATEDRSLIEINQRRKIKQLESLGEEGKAREEEGRARESALQKRVDNLSAELAAKIEQNKSLEKRLEFEYKYCPARMNRKALEEAAKKLERDNCELAKQIQQKDTANYNQQKVISNLQEKNWQSESFKELEKQKKNNFQLRQQNMHLQTSLDRNIKQTELALTELTKELAIARQNHDDSKRAFQSRLAEKQKETINIKRDLRTKTPEIEKCKSEAKMLRSQLRTARTEVAKIGYERDMAAKKMRSMGAIFEHLSEPSSTVFMLRHENRQLKLQLTAKDRDLLVANTKIREAIDKANGSVIAQHVRDSFMKNQTIKDHKAELEEKATITDRKEYDVTLLHSKLVESDLKLAKSEGKLANFLATAATVRADIASKLSKLQEFDVQNEILLSLNRLPLNEKKGKRHRFYANQIRGFRLRAEAEASDAIVQEELPQEEQTESDDADAEEMIAPNGRLLNWPELEKPNTVHADSDTLILSCAETTAFINSLSKQGLEFVSRDRFSQYLSGTYTSEEDCETNFDIASPKFGESENEDTTDKMSSLHAFAWRLCFGTILLYLASIIYGVSWSFLQGMSQSPSPKLDSLPMKPEVTAKFAGNSSFTSIDGFEGVVRYPLIVSVKATAPEFQDVPDIPSYRVSASQVESYIFGNMYCKSHFSSMNMPEPKSRLDSTTDNAKTMEVVPTSATLPKIHQVACTSTAMIVEGSSSPKPSANDYTTAVAQWKSSLLRFGKTAEDNLSIEIAGMFSIFAIFAVWLI